MTNIRAALKSCKSQLPSIISKSSETIIKPATPTPAHLGRYNLSSIDIMTPNFYIPLLLFFPRSTATNDDQSVISNNLKRSLSQTLTHYYPFAGRLKSTESYVDCNDQGVEFIEAQVNCKMDELIYENGNDDDCDSHKSLHHLFPPGSVWGQVDNSNNSGPLMIVQLNWFDCGGLAISVCMTHRLTDAFGLSSFLTFWAALASQSGTQVNPHIVSWPAQSNSDVWSSTTYINHSQKNWITKRFVFHNSSLARLKDKVANNGIMNPTRVEVLAAILYKSAIHAASSFSPSLLIQLANVRTKFMLPETAMGNFFWPFVVEAREEGDATLQNLCHNIKKMKLQLRNMESRDMNAASLKVGTLNNLNKKCDVYMCSSFCNFPLYDVNFGWGKPIKVSLPDGQCINYFSLMDTPSGDGIEAMVCLAKEHMLRFQCDSDIVAAVAADSVNN